ncbi:hypothetical protein ABE039_20760 [Priestia megaterium]
MKIERIFDKDLTFSEILIPLMDNFIEQIVEGLYNNERVDTVMAQSLKEREYIEL